MFRLRAAASAGIRSVGSAEPIRSIVRASAPAISTILSPRDGTCRYRTTKAPTRRPPKEKKILETGGITVARSKGKETGYCYGCGADLVKGEAGSMGTVTKNNNFWAQKKDLLKKSKIKNWALCPRCRRLLKAEEKGNIEAEIEALAPDNKMTEVFRQEVSKIRKIEKAVIVLCVDAININGTLLATIRNYVGGSPILLAVTRCDLLPDYVWESEDLNSIKNVIRKRATGIKPAEVYLCSESSKVRRKLGGIQELISDIWEHRKGRDPYIVGCANIGKSTLTDIIISDFILKGERDGSFGDRLSRKRLERLQEARSTKSALPGTTLGNVRVPCFEDHEQALWDTPGLLVDDSLHQFPIRNFRVIRARRPEQIEPQMFLEEERKSVALIITEKGDDVPLLRVEIRLKKSDEGEGPIRIVWNSTLPVSAKLCDIEEARAEEQTRFKEGKEQAAQNDQHEEHQERVTTEKMTAEERKARREKRRQDYLDRVADEKREMGLTEWNRREKERLDKMEKERRAKALSKLAEVHDVIVEKEVGLDIAIAHFGWLGVMMPRTAMIRTYAPKTGVRVTTYDALALPSDWGSYKSQSEASRDSEGKDKDGKIDDDDSVFHGDSVEETDDDDDDEYDDFDSEEYNDEDMYDDEAAGDYFGDEWGYDGLGSEGYVYDTEDEAEEDRAGDEYARFKMSRIPKEERDKWADFQGAKVGWQYDEDTRWTGGREDGWNPIPRETSRGERKVPAA